MAGCPLIFMLCLLVLLCKNVTDTYLCRSEFVSQKPTFKRSLNNKKKS